jgi:small ligand-binding sensory domain FIST
VTTKMGVGLSKLKDPEAALQEAYRKSLQRMKATKADLCLIFYSYDYGMDTGVLAGALKKVFRDTPHGGSSTWSVWSDKETVEGETGLMVFSFKDVDFEHHFLKVHSLREKSELWSAELARQLTDFSTETADFLWLIADSLNFNAGNGFQFLERHFPKLQILGFGTSFSVPQSSVICNGEVYTNSLLALSARGLKPWAALLQSIKPELASVAVNRMSENLIIELDSKPAFYRLCEHLMTSDDLPMMSPDEFRKHMGNLFIVEKPKVAHEYPRTLGEPYRVVSLLGSEMTTGMVAVANALDFSQIHYLGQKKIAYAESETEKLLQELKMKVPEPSMLWMITAASRMRERERQKTDFAILRSIFPETPILGVASNGEFLGGVNQFASLVVAF